MQPAENFKPEQLIGKKVVFRSDPDHQTCWHFRVGLESGVVLRVGQSLAQKAQLIEAEGGAPPELFDAEADVPRLWVRGDPCPALPRGCETAVEPGCLLVVNPPPTS